MKRFVRRTLASTYERVAAAWPAPIEPCSPDRPHPVPCTLLRKET